MKARNYDRPKLQGSSAASMSEDKFSLMGSPEFSRAQWRIIAIGLCAFFLVYLTPLLRAFKIGDLSGGFFIGACLFSTSLVYVQFTERIGKVSKASNVRFALSAIAANIVVVVLAMAGGGFAENLQSLQSISSFKFWGSKH